MTIINYLKTNIEVLIASRVSSQINTITIHSLDDDIGHQYQGANEYERLLRRYEADIRGYISVINKLRINLDSLISKNEQLEKIASEFERTKNNPMILVKDYQKEIQDLNILVKTYERNNLKIPVLEKKLKKQKIELNTYQEKIRSYSKKIEEYERDCSMTRTITLSHYDSISKMNQDETIINQKQSEVVNYNDMTMANLHTHFPKESHCSIKARNTSEKKKSNSILTMMKEGRQNRNKNKQKAKMIPKCNSIVYLKDHFNKNSLKKKSNNPNLSFSSRDQRNNQRDKSILNNYSTFDTINHTCSSTNTNVKENNSKCCNEQNDISIINNTKVIEKRFQCVSGVKRKKGLKTQSLMK